MPIASHQQHVRRILGVLAGLFVAIAPVVFAASMTTKVGATSEYANAAIADKALSYVGRWGGHACIDSHKPGDSGGQCRSFVNCIVWMASGGTQNLGGRDYFRPFIAAGGQEIKTVDELQKGDIVQEGQGRHTYIIVGRIAGNTFSIVDSNHRWNERVSTYDREVTLSYSKRAFRMGSVAPSAQLAAAQIKPMLGALDTVEPADGGAIVRGWVIDSDVTRPVNAQILVGDETNKQDDSKTQTFRADAPRMDVAAQYGRYGSAHGFRSFVKLDKGDHVVCVYGVNAPGTPGDDLKLGCRAVGVK